MKDDINYPKYPYGCIQFNSDEIKNTLGLITVCKFEKKEILDKDKRREIFNDINTKCKEYKVWALLGGIEAEQWICLQVASASNISKEIISDIKCMLPLTLKDTRPWKSRFHEKVFEVQYGLDVRCQKYRDMSERFDRFCIILIEPEKYLKDISDTYNQEKYAEVKFAYDTQALYWNPIKEEHKILNQIQLNAQYRL